MKEEVIVELLKKQIKGERKLIGLIRVLTITDEHLLNAHGKIIEEKFPNLKVISRCIENQPKGVYDFESERKSIPKIVSMGEILEKENVRAIIISCADDPGVSVLRQEVKVPVIGAGTACASLASIYGIRVGVLGITDFPPTAMTKVLGERLVAYEKPSRVSTTADLASNKDAIFEAAERLFNQNIDILALGCTGYSTLNIASELKKKFNKMVIDPVIAAGLYAYYTLFF